MSKEKGKRRRMLGSFSVASDRTFPGELRIRGGKSSLTIHADEELFLDDSGVVINGRSREGIHVTLVDCILTGSSTRYTVDEGSPVHGQASYFPHYVVVGDRHLPVESPCICEVRFTTEDLPTLFRDVDAFGQIFDQNGVIDTVLLERRKKRSIEVGAVPVISYFTGKTKVAEVVTPLGNVSVNHHPTGNSGGPKGVYIKNKMHVAITFDSPCDFERAMLSITTMCSFLSVAAGRSQRARKMEVVTAGLQAEEYRRPLRVHSSMAWNVKDNVDHLRPQHGDLPLDPVRRKEEFGVVLVDWLRRHDAWRVARNTNLDGMRRGESYGGARLVASANMFDLLPSDAVPNKSELTAEMMDAKVQCTAILRRLPHGYERESALNAIGRVGRPSLTKRVLHRAHIVASKAAGHLNELDLVVRTAIASRNYFVHGDEHYDFSRMSPHVSFLTDSLEFIFGASDLIESGWDFERWLAGGKGYGHGYSRYMLRYPAGLVQLKRTLNDLNSVQ